MPNWVCIAGGWLLGGLKLIAFSLLILAPLSLGIGLFAVGMTLNILWCALLGGGILIIGLVVGACLLMWDIDGRAYADRCARYWKERKDA